jgi:hypothetical protein
MIGWLLTWLNLISDHVSNEIELNYFSSASTSLIPFFADFSVTFFGAMPFDGMQLGNP